MGNVAGGYVLGVSSADTRLSFTHMMSRIESITTHQPSRLVRASRQLRHRDSGQWIANGKHHQGDASCARNRLVWCNSMRPTAAPDLLSPV
jgi:hypothetical protein